MYNEYLDTFIGAIYPWCGIRIGHISIISFFSLKFEVAVFDAFFIIEKLLIRE